LQGYFKQEYSLASKLRTAMIYPAVVLSLAIAITTFLLIYIVPMFQSIFENAHMALPLPTRIMLAASGFVRTQYPLILIVIISLILIYRTYSRSCKRQACDRPLEAEGPRLRPALFEAHGVALHKNARRDVHGPACR